MRLFCTIIIALFVSICAVQSQPIAEVALEDVQVRTIDNFAEADGYYIFVPDTPEDEPLNLTVFVHGFGALNPIVYGGWIAHLVKHGNAVIFVRYQEGIFSTPTEDFVPNSVKAIQAAQLELKAGNYAFDDSYMDLIGHSYGGVIIGNIAANHMSLGVPGPRIALLCEPGTGPLTGGLLESYDGMDENLMLAVVVGDEDHTVGQKIGLRVFETAINTPGRVLFWQYADENGSEEIGASHYEPYSYDSAFDNGIENFTIKRASKVSRLDAVDTHGYWQIFDTLQDCVEGGQCTLQSKTLQQLAHLGTWADGSDIRNMEVRTP